MEDNHSYIKTKLNEAKTEKDVGGEVSLLLKNGDEVYGELLSVRNSTIVLCREYSAKEEELSKLTYPISVISNNDIQQLTLEGTSWVWEGIGAGYLVGGLAGVAIGSTFDDSKEKAFGVIGLMIAMGTVGAITGGITGYALSQEEYVIKDVPPDYNWFILKPISRYPDKEPKYLKSIE
jgi:hypothetical protein